MGSIVAEEIQCIQGIVLVKMLGNNVGNNIGDEKQKNCQKE